jgi:hypothetical protein
MTVGLSGLVASVIAGQLWDNASHSAVLSLCAFFAVTGGLALL